MTNLQIYSDRDGDIWVGKDDDHLFCLDMDDIVNHHPRQTLLEVTMYGPLVDMVTGDTITRQDTVLTKVVRHANRG